VEDTKKGLEWLMKAAEQVHAVEARQHMPAVAYLNGRDVAKDIKNAAAWIGLLLDIESKISPAALLKRPDLTERFEHLLETTYITQFPFTNWAYIR
jgi:hypothetical protein